MENSEISISNTNSKSTTSQNGECTIARGKQIFEKKKWYAI